MTPRSFLGVICLVCSACSRNPGNPPPAQPTNAPAAKSSLATAVDGFTGKTAVDQFKRAKSTVQDAEALKKQQMDEALAK